MEEPSLSEDPRRVELFFAALERSHLGERKAFLEQETRDNPALRAWLDAEIRKQTGPSESTPEVELLLAALRPEEIGDTIGPYKLLNQLGQGGFGIVWLAEQETPVRRKVALKIVKAGMDTRRVVARFAQERQALAMLDHPGVAKVYDAGATPTGRPFYAMELVRGEPITDYCDLHKLTLRARLELFMRVCFAVQHAHQKGIIHRDLKPSNLLVATQEDGLPMPKVIDLGLAKALQGMPGDHTLVVTVDEKMIGTPLYMSPEQAEGSADLDTRTDIYSLGAVLYEMLTGHPPHDPETMSKGTYESVCRAIREHEPARPSGALRLLRPGQLDTVARHCQAEPAALIRSVRGEVDAICMKALEKDPRRRYATAAALAADVQHLLLNEPIAARPASQWYRLRKLAYRNRGSVVAGSLIFLAILGGSVISVREALRARLAESEARSAQEKEAAHREEAEDLRTRAELERAVARRNEYIADVNLAEQALKAGNPGRALALLDRHRPLPGHTDQRGWNWRYLWKLAQGDPHRPLERHPGPVSGLALAADGKTILYPDGAAGRLSSADGLASAAIVAGGVQLSGATELFLAGARPPLAFSPDGQTLAAMGEGGLTLWPLDGSPARRMEDSAHLFDYGASRMLHFTQRIAFSPDGRTIAAGENHPSELPAFSLRLWETESGKRLATLPENPEAAEYTGAITSVAFSPDGATLAGGSLDYSVRLWDWRGKRRLRTLQGHRAEVGAVLFLPDGQTLLSGDRQGEVKAWAWSEEPLRDFLPDIDQPLGFSPDGRRLAVVQHGRSVGIYNAETRAEERFFPLESHAGGEEPVVAISADLHTLAQGVPGGRVKITNLESGESVSETDPSGPIDVLAVSPDGKAIVAGSRGHPLRLIDRGKDEVTPLPFSARLVLFSPDGDTLALFAEEKSGGHSLILWSLSAGAARVRVPVPVGEVPDAAFSPDGSLLAAGLENRVGIWGTGTGVYLGACAGHKQLVRGVAFAWDGYSLASTSEDGTVRFWNAATQQEMMSLPFRGSALSALLFSPNDRTFVLARHTGRQPPEILFLRAPPLEVTDAR